jgi:hypothetical protein
MNRRVGALVVMLGAASLLVGCGSGSPASPTPLAVQASLQASLGPSLTPSPATATPVLETSAPPIATPSPSPTPFAVTSYVPAPQPSLAVFAAGAPAIPTRARLDYLTDPCQSANSDESCSWLRAGWQEANPSGATIRVYAFTACLHTPTAAKPNTNCLEDGDTIPRASLVLLGSAPASARSLSFTLDVGGEGSTFGRLPGGGPEVQAIVIQAVNAMGGSLFVIVASSGSCYGCVL